MTVADETKRLRLMIERLAAEADSDPVVVRYPPRFGRMRLGLYRRVRIAVGDVLRGLGLRARPVPKPWRVGLRHAERTEEAGPLVLWALGAERDALRRACLAFKAIEPELLPELVPVLVTDVTDFAFFSRLGWLVEYLPRLEGDGEPYERRKARFLARLYRGAPVLPVTAGLELEENGERIRRWLRQRE